MKKFLALLLLLLLWARPALAQSNPGWTFGFVPSAAQWNAEWSSKVDVNLTGIPVTSGGTGGIVWGAGNPLIGAGSGALAQGTRSGNTTVFGTVNGVLTAGDCVSLDSSFNLVDAGGVCTTGGGGGTVTSGLINELAWYSANGTAVVGLATANNGVLLTSGSGVPSIADAGTLAFTATGASVSRSLAVYASDAENVINFGADPTGVASSTTAFQNAFAAGGNIFVPCGTYKLNAVWSSPIGAKIEGGGIGCTKLEPFTPGTDVLKITSGNFDTIQNLAVVTTSSSGNGIELDGNTGNTNLTNLSVGGTSGTNGFANGVLADGGTGASGLYIQGGWYLDNSGSGLNLAGTVSNGVADYHVVGAQFGGNATAGITAAYASAGQIDDNFIWSNGKGINASNSNYLWADRNRITQSGQQGIECTTCQFINFQNNQFYQNSNTTIGAVPDIDLFVVAYALIDGNNMFDWTGTAHTNYAVRADVNSNTLDIENNNFLDHTVGSTSIANTFDLILRNNLPTTDAMANSCSQASALLSATSSVTTVAGTGTTVYLGGFVSSTEAPTPWPIPGYYNICAFTVFLGTAPGAGQTQTFTLRKNLVSTGLTAAASGASAFNATAASPTNVVAVGPTDAIDIMMVSSGSAAATTVRYTVGLAVQ